MGTKKYDPKKAIKGQAVDYSSIIKPAKKGKIIDQMDIISGKVKFDNGKTIGDAKKNNNVIICGTAGSLEQTPWGKKDYDFWACAPVITHKPAVGKRFDTLFEMHKAEYWMQKDVMDRINGYTKENGNVLIMQDAYYQYINSVKYPLKEIQEFVKHDKLKKYFTNSIAFMIALAIYLGYERIELYGVHMAADEEEYSGQRSCCEAWLNYGLGRGVDYWLPPESDVMKSEYIYGFEQEKDVLLNVIHMKQGFSNAVTEIEKKFEDIKEDLYMHRGAVKGADLIIKDLRRKGG